MLSNAYLIVSNFLVISKKNTKILIDYKLDDFLVKNIQWESSKDNNKKSLIFILQ